MTDLIEVISCEKVIANVPGVVGQLAVGPQHFGIAIPDFAILNHLKIHKEFRHLTICISDFIQSKTNM
jgi:hypothetical protein